MQTRHLLAGALAMGAVLTPVLGALQPQSNDSGSGSAAPARKNVAAHSSKTPEDEGQHIFETQCSRCHNAPEGFSPRISGTIVRHMRVRASLSQREEQVLLHFFNP